MNKTVRFTAIAMTVFALAACGEKEAKQAATVSPPSVVPSAPTPAPQPPSSMPAQQSAPPTFEQCTRACQQTSEFLDCTSAHGTADKCIEIGHQCVTRNCLNLK